MFEIGNSLHEARVRQAVSLPAAEVGTKIRAKYLKALEEEQFDALPAQTYVKGFLRTYADFLGLDGQLYVDEYNSRFVLAEDDGRVLRPRRSDARPARRSSGFESRAVLLTLAAIAIVSALVIVAWKSGGGNKRIPSSETSTVVTKPSRGKRATAARGIIRLTLSARAGNSKVQVYSSSQGGKLLLDGTLLRGKTIAIPLRKRYWLDVTVPRNVVLHVNGHPHRLAGRTERAYVVTAQGVTPVPLG